MRIMNIATIIDEILFSLYFSTNPSNHIDL